MKKAIIIIGIIFITIAMTATVTNAQPVYRFDSYKDDTLRDYYVSNTEINYFFPSLMEIHFTDNFSLTFIDWLDAGIGWTGKTYFSPDLFVGSYNGTTGKTTLDNGGLFSSMKFGPFFGSWNVWNDTWTGENVLGYSVNLRQNITRYGMNVVNLWYGDYICLSMGAYIANYDSWVHDTSGNHIGWTNSNIQAAQAYNRNNTGKTVGIRLSAMVYCIELGFSFSSVDKQFDITFTSKGIFRHMFNDINR